MCYAVLSYRWGQSGFEQTGVSALRTLRGLSADEFLDELLGGKLFFWKQLRSGLELADSQLFLFPTTGKEAIVTDFCKAVRQDMHKETTDKFFSI